MNRILFFGMYCSLLLLAATAGAHPLEVWTQQPLNSMQDEWVIQGHADELGTGLSFPSDESITSSSRLTTYIPCPADYGGGRNYEITIVNISGKDWANLYYVSDPETCFSNGDEAVGQSGSLHAWGAFCIDYVGENTPLVYESMIQDNIFQDGETWKFVIQDYENDHGLSAAAFSSLGIADFSAGDTLSSGSIISVPEPATLALLSLGGVALLRRRS
jgi:hypothetical protein